MQFLIIGLIGYGIFKALGCGCGAFGCGCKAFSKKK